MGTDVQSDIRFDFEGSLALARRLWSTAEQFSGAAGERAGARENAIRLWEGPYAEVFASIRRVDEDNSFVNVMAALQEEALYWAVAWKTAIDGQNRIEWARAVEREKAQRSSMEKFGDWWVGDDSSSQVPEPAAVAVPAAPDFQPTGGLVSYGHLGDHWYISYDGACVG